jgi:hypothetical protein
MNNQQRDYLERWVGQEQIIYLLFAVLMILVSILAFMNYQPASSTETVESSAGELVITEAPVLNNFLLLLFAIPAVAGVWILYWIRKRENVRALTENVLIRDINRLRIMGLALAAFSVFLFFSQYNTLQSIVVAPIALAFGLINVYRGFKLAGYRALGGL